MKSLPCDAQGNLFTFLMTSKLLARQSGIVMEISNVMLQRPLAPLASVKVSTSKIKTHRKGGMKIKIFFYTRHRLSNTSFMDVYYFYYYAEFLCTFPISNS